MSFDVFGNIKGHLILLKMLVDKIKYIKNEYDMLNFLIWSFRIKKLTLVEVLQSICLRYFKVENLLR